MPRPVSELRTSSPDVEHAKRDLGVTRRTARSFAAAVSVLLMATLVVNRSDAALNGDAASASSMITSGTIELTDDDQGRSLFDLSDLTPARPVERCIAVTYAGTILPVALAVRAEADGELADYLDVVIVEGSGGGFASCTDFVPTRTVFEGPLGGLVEEGWVQLGELLNADDARSYRIELSVQDRLEALGKAMSFELAWEVTPS